MTNEQLLVYIRSLRLILETAVAQVRKELPVELKPYVKEFNIFDPEAMVETCPVLSPLYAIINEMRENEDILSRVTMIPSQE